jgi:hypothetical protein
MTAQWWIILARWVLQDGSYTDFVTGEHRQFALEFWWRRGDRLEPSSGATAPGCRYTGQDAWYDVTGPLQRVPDDRHATTYLLDIGIQAYRWTPLEHLEQRTDDGWVSGEIGVGVDHFTYMDHLAPVPGMPPLIHTWSIDEIQIHSAAGEWRTVDRTRAWEVDGVYRLRCTLLDVPPVASMAASGPRSPYGPLT